MFVGDDDTAQINGLLGEDGCCWVCLEAENPEDLFYPCNCKLHRKCIKQWVAQVIVMCVRGRGEESVVQIR